MEQIANLIGKINIAPMINVPRPVSSPRPEKSNSEPRETESFSDIMKSKRINSIEKDDKTEKSDSGNEEKSMELLAYVAANCLSNDANLQVQEEGNLQADASQIAPVNPATEQAVKAELVPAQAANDSYIEIIDKSKASMNLPQNAAEKEGEVKPVAAEQVVKGEEFFNKLLDRQTSGEYLEKITSRPENGQAKIMDYLPQTKNSMEITENQGQLQLKIPVKGEKTINVLVQTLDTAQALKPDLKVPSASALNDLRLSKMVEDFVRQSVQNSLSKQVTNDKLSGSFTKNFDITDIIGQTKDVKPQVSETNSSMTDINKNLNNQGSTQNEKAADGSVRVAASATAEISEDNAADRKDIIANIKDRPVAQNIQTGNIAGKDKVIHASNSEVRVHIADLVKYIQNKIGEKQGMQQISIKLDPPNLGEVMVKISMEDQKVHVQFNVNNMTVKEILEDNMSNLLDNCVKRGIDVGGFDINQNNENSNKEMYAQAAKQMNRNSQDEDFNTIVKEAKSKTLLSILV